VTDENVSGNEGDSATSLSLLERARANDKAAWERLDSLYGPLVESWCLRARLQEADVKDVRQDVFTAVFRKIGDFRRDRPGDTFRGWLRTITQSKIADHWRLARAEPPGQGGSDAVTQMQQVPTPETSDSGNSSDVEEINRLHRRALDLIRHDFEERSWQAFWRVVIEEQRPQDVAADLGMTVNAVYLAKGRVLGRLREEFGELLDT
jgi:RNA polymerase sigma-70 factor (ECF subfamily)